MNSDRYIKRFKGIKSPIQNEIERAKNLCEFGSVDGVIIFYEDTPARLIADIKPDVLVKGGDYTIESIIGAGDVLASGGRVEIVPLTPGYSTSRNLEKMNR